MKEIDRHLGVGGNNTSLYKVFNSFYLFLTAPIPFDSKGKFSKNSTPFETFHVILSAHARPLIYAPSSFNRQF